MRQIYTRNKTDVKRNDGCNNRLPGIPHICHDLENQAITFNARTPLYLRDQFLPQQKLQLLVHVQ